MDNSRQTLTVIHLVVCVCFFSLLIQPTIVQAQRCRGKPEMIEYGDLILHESKKYYTYQCDPGYSYRYLNTDIRRDRVTCNNGKWMHSGDCRPDVDETKLCPPVPDLNNGRTFLEGRNPGNIVEFICDVGYTLEGSNTRTCYDDFRWTGSDPECVGGEKTVEGLAKSLKKNFIDPNAAATSTGGEESSARLTPGKNGLELFFLVDRSSSISEMNLNKAKKLMVQIMKVFNISSEPNGGNAGTRVAVITYSQQAEVLFMLDDPNIRSVAAFEQKLSEIKAHGGGTNLQTALARVRSKTMTSVRNNANKAIFVITDGKSTEGVDTLVGQANNIKQAGYEIFALGIGDNVNTEELYKIVSEKVPLHLFVISNFKDLAEIADIIAEKKDFRLCGESGDTHQIPSVAKSKKDAWPWIGWYLRRSRNSKPVTCGGALVCDTWFMTAARCLHDDDGNVTRPQDIDLYLGTHELTNPNQENAIGTKPIGVFIHPNYNHSYYLIKDYSKNKKEYYMDLFYSEYDVALLQLNNASDGGPPLSPSIRPICALRREEVEEVKGFLTLGQLRLEDMLNDESQSYERRKKEQVFVAGWGFSPEGATRVTRIRSDLHQSRGLVDNPAFCKRNNPNADPKKFFCVVDKDHKLSDYCNSDVGGPYMAEINGKFAILGIALENADCTTRSNVYLNVLHSNITSWIQTTLGNCSDPNDWLNPNNPYNKGGP